MVTVDGMGWAWWRVGVTARLPYLRSRLRAAWGSVPPRTETRPEQRRNGAAKKRRDPSLKKAKRRFFYHGVLRSLDALFSWAVLCREPQATVLEFSNVSLSLSPLSGLFFWATQDPRLDNDVAELHVPAVFVPVLDDAGEDDAANLPVGQVLLVLLSAHVLHSVRLEQHLLVRQDVGHVHP